MKNRANTVGWDVEEKAFIGYHHTGEVSFIKNEGSNNAYCFSQGVTKNYIIAMLRLKVK